MKATSDGGLDPASFTRLLLEVCAAMTASIDDFTHADQAVGDGDHGLAIGRGFRAASEFIASRDHVDVGELLDGMGMAMLTSMGGASGAIYGTMFRRGGRALVGRKTFDSEAFAAFLEAGLGGVRERGGAKLGDKTIVDAIEPAATAARASVGRSLSEAIAAVAEAANEGARSTMDMRASVGRAKTLGERAVGHVDPGALSFASLMGHMGRLVVEFPRSPTDG